MFSLHDIRHSFGDTTVLHQISLDIEEGATTVLLGASGCGKSTLLRLMLGLIAPDSGTITFNGQTITPATALTMRRQMGYVIQHGGMFPHMSAQANITLMARYLGYHKDWQKARLEELRELTSFPEEGLAKYPGQLSGGQRQRVALMRALMLDPPVLLLDEPLGALDSIVRRQLQSDLRAIFAQLGTTVVLVTHDVAEAAYFSQDLVMLCAGRIVQRGSVRTMLDHPGEDYVTQFLTAQRGLSDVIDAEAA